MGFDYKFTVTEDIVCQIGYQLWKNDEMYRRMFHVSTPFKVCILCADEKDKDFMRRWLFKILYKNYHRNTLSCFVDKLFIFADCERDLLGQNFFHIYFSKKLQDTGVWGEYLRNEVFEHTNALIEAAFWRSRSRTGAIEGLPIILRGEVDYKDE